MKKLIPGLRLRGSGHTSPYAKYNKRPYNYTTMYRLLQEKDPDSPLAKHRRRQGRD